MIENEPMADYLNNEAIGSSSLKKILLSAKDYKYALKAKSKESKAQVLGTYIHTYMLERHLMDDQYMIQPEDWGSLSKNPGRAKWTELKKQAEEAGKKAVKYSDGEFALNLNSEMEEHEPLKGILSSAKAEVSFYAEIDGIKLKSREDLWCPEDRSVWDVKSNSKGMDDEALEKIIFNNGYHFSAAHHMNVMNAAGFPVNRWGWIFVSTGTPCPHIIIKEADEELLEAGRRDWKYAFETLKECIETGEWRGYYQGIQKIGLPEWVKNKYY
ncbi:hypothetical protein CMI37_20730 [Candidatus Pacearchaeota archaeon]|nr:hypothetical protein [Candidatus Pacearchaeota archaeon]|tara:strand:+ start:387 stop:1196 length:810 start_codon:yes stop_codon:yes gene_type:complete